MNKDPHWHIMTFDLGKCSAGEIYSKVSDSLNIVRPLLKKKSKSSAWFRVQQSGFSSFAGIPPRELVVLVPGLDAYTIEVYKDLGFDIRKGEHISRKTRRIHYKRFEPWKTV